MSIATIAFCYVIGYLAAYWLVLFAHHKAVSAGMQPDDDAEWMATWCAVAWPFSLPVMVYVWLTTHKNREDAASASHHRRRT
jgi:hypothetical protein